MENPPATSRHWPLFLAGAILSLAGVIAYVIQVSLARLEWAPWYMPGLASAGVVLMVLSVWQRPGLLRIVGLAFFTLLCAAEWLFVAVLPNTPTYHGPATLGTRLPAFTTTFADGRPFSNNDLVADKATVLVFFRGRW